MNTITKDNLIMIQDAVKPALEQISNDLGVSITIGRGSYDNKANGHFKVNIATLGEGGEVETKEWSDYKSCCHWHECKPEWLGENFCTGNGEFQLIGMKTRGRKFPFIAKSLSDGKTYKFTAESIKFGFKAYLG